MSSSKWRIKKALWNSLNLEVSIDNKCDIWTAAIQKMNIAVPRKTELLNESFSAKDGLPYKELLLKQASEIPQILQIAMIVLGFSLPPSGLWGHFTDMVHIHAGKTHEFNNKEKNNKPINE